MPLEDVALNELTNFVRAGSITGVANGIGSKKTRTRATSRARHQPLQKNIFAAGDWGGKILEPAFDAGQTLTMGAISTASFEMCEINNSTAPVLTVTGQRDVIFCGTDCSAVGDRGMDSLLDVSEDFFPLASTFQTVVIPAFGHGLNLESDATSPAHQESAGLIRGRRNIHSR
ncbi:hypothetical protein BJ170DRAFT_694258 [Xylariales sp. AK1849]|nr:hypothetical protein BJ170DRAFT_694258 [Xylariales sp. AK1849]